MGRRFVGLSVFRSVVLSFRDGVAENEQRRIRTARRNDQNDEPTKAHLVFDQRRMVSKAGFRPELDIA